MAMLMYNILEYSDKLPKQLKVYANVVEMKQMIIRRIQNHLNLNKNLQITPKSQVIVIWK